MNDHESDPGEEDDSEKEREELKVSTEEFREMFQRLQEIETKFREFETLGEDEELKVMYELETGEPDIPRFRLQRGEHEDRLTESTRREVFLEAVATTIVGTISILLVSVILIKTLAPELIAPPLYTASGAVFLLILIIAMAFRASIGKS